MSQNNQNNQIHLKDYTTPAFQVNSVSLDFNLNEDSTILKSLTTYKKLKSEPLTLNGEDLKLISIKMNGDDLNKKLFTLSETHLIIPNPPDEFELEIVTELNPQENTSLEGLYKSNNIFCTQCEAQGFRKITYFQDRPDVMTTYNVRIEADKTKYPVLLSNGDRIQSRDLSNNRHEVFWRDPHKKPCYLFALVAGNLGVIRDHFTTKSGKKVNLEVYALDGLQERCFHAIHSLKKAMKWDEDTYGLEYDLNDYMIVAIDDFNAGAMENKGLNIFNSRLVLANPQTATDQDYFNIESVVAHEYFHNWTGNRVTLNSWFQLSLKEGLTVFRDQEFSADISHRGVQRINDVENLRESQFIEDTSPQAHPVRPESCLAVDNFFTTTIYEKGAELIRMMQVLVGKKGFKKGMSEYFKRHDGQAVTTDDFALSISEPNQKNFTQFKLWYSQAGTPTVELCEEYRPEDQTYILKFKQKPFLSNSKAFHIPLLFKFFNSNGQAWNMQKVLENIFLDVSLDTPAVELNSDKDPLINLTHFEQEIIFKSITEKPILSILREFSAPIILKFNQTKEDLIQLMKFDDDLFVKKESLQKLVLQELNYILTHSNSVLSENAPLIFDSLDHLLNDKNLYFGIKNHLLCIPSIERMGQEFGRLDPIQFNEAREFFINQLSLHISSTLEFHFNLLSQENLDQYSAENFEKRNFKNNCLELLLKAHPSQYLHFAKNQLENSTNMSDQFAALNLLCNFSKTERQNSSHFFYEKWKNESLVLNKWLSSLSQVTHENIVNEIKEVLVHPGFNIKNPNNVYSLMRNFGRNIVQIYNGHPQNLDFYLDFIHKVDQFNPQVAARLCGELKIVPKLCAPLKQMALSQIKTHLDNKAWSKNTYELLEKSSHDL